MSLEEAIRLFGLSAVLDRRRLRARYRRLAFLYHPDRNGGSPESFATFKRVRRAYVLLDAALRAEGESADVCCARCHTRRAFSRGLDRNPYCRDCLVYADGRRLLPSPPAIIVSCAFAIGTTVASVVLLGLLIATRRAEFGWAALATGLGGLAFLAITAVTVGEVARPRIRR